MYSGEDYLASVDNDLLNLHRYPGITVLSASAFRPPITHQPDKG
jgi:hypothetical protein